jgi:2-alkenal reductase
MRYNLPAQWGVYVTDVAANSPASQAGLQPGDIITRIGEVSIDETHSYFNALFQYQPGDIVPVGVVRDSREFQVEVRLGESNSS